MQVRGTDEKASRSLFNESSKNFDERLPPK